nr:ATP synthase F0 subunit 8 [Thaumatocrinus sp. JL223]
MPQLDIFWWGFNFFSCWLFFFVLYIYLTNIKVLSFNFALSGFYNFVCLKSFVWLW